MEGENGKICKRSGFGRSFSQMLWRSQINIGYDLYISFSCDFSVRGLGVLNNFALRLTSSLCKMCVVYVDTHVFYNSLFGTVSLAL